MRPGRCLCPPPCGTLFLCRTPAPLAHLKDVLPDALRGGRTRRRRGQGGSGARAAAPECLGVLLWRYGHIDHPRGWCEVARGRCNGRSCTYSSGPETLVPLSPTHGPSVCTWRHYQTLKVTSVFNICRPGDAVVSGPRETRHNGTLTCARSDYTYEESARPSFRTCHLRARRTPARESTLARRTSHAALFAAHRAAHVRPVILDPALTSFEGASTSIIIGFTWGPEGPGGGTAVSARLLRLPFRGPPSLGCPTSRM
jgi:hypothetical protein